MLQEIVQVDAFLTNYIPNTTEAGLQPIMWQFLTIKEKQQAFLTTM